MTGMGSQTPSNAYHAPAERPAPTAPRPAQAIAARNRCSAQPLLGAIEHRGDHVHTGMTALDHTRGDQGGEPLVVETHPCRGGARHDAAGMATEGRDDRRV